MDWFLAQATHKLVVDLHIDADAFVRLYSGSATTVVARARSGLRVQFPAGALRPFVLHNGIHGVFEIVIDEHNKLQSLNRIG